MATSLYRNKNRVRPRKKAGPRRQRAKVQQQRLINLGVPETTVAKLNQKEIRTLLRRPTRVLRVLGIAE